MALMKAAALIVVAIGAAEGARRFGFHWPQRAVEEVPIEAPPPVVESGPKAERGAAPPDARPVAPVVAENRAAAIAPSKTAPSKAAASKPTTAAARRRAVRPENSSEQRVVPAVAPAPGTGNTCACTTTRPPRPRRRRHPRHPPAASSNVPMLTSRRRSQPASSRSCRPIFRLGRMPLSSFACSFRRRVIRSASVCFAGPCWVARRTRLS